MKIRLIVPITGLNHQEIQKRVDYLTSIADPETTIDYRQVKNGPPAIESEADAVLAGPDILKLAVEAQKDGVDAAIIWCGGDPSIDAARKLVDIPIIGPGESMRAIASTLGKKPCNIIPDIPVLKMRTNLTRTTQAIKEIIQDKATKGEGDVFYLGCLALYGLGPSLREALGVPILDGAEASLKTAELTVKLGLSHSRIAYPRKH
ncbi:MAG: aspartate/glutamate racemase family protein [Candidatus Bathyarchaeota archaeon]|nr:aspartate/glutamate racemase family protein [Candidatus Bathyarchaeota archaeon]